jgi:hypothetical protein
MYLQYKVLYLILTRPKFAVKGTVNTVKASTFVILLYENTFFLVGLPHFFP